MKSAYQYLLGKWIHTAEWDTDDWMSEYIISGSEDNPIITARDIHDSEEFEITDIKWDGRTLTFTSRMPSTGRIGVNKFEIKSENEMAAEFTFTEIDILKRINT